jgi:hypothetical protein
MNPIVLIFSVLCLVLVSSYTSPRLLLVEFTAINGKVVSGMKTFRKIQLLPDKYQIFNQYFENK